jgi:hypothetical protein
MKLLDFRSYFRLVAPLPVNLVARTMSRVCYRRLSDGLWPDKHPAFAVSSRVYQDVDASLRRDKTTLQHSGGTRESL